MACGWTATNARAWSPFRRVSLQATYPGKARCFMATSRGRRLGQTSTIAPRQTFVRISGHQATKGRPYTGSAVICTMLVRRRGRPSSTPPFRGGANSANSFCDLSCPFRLTSIKSRSPESRTSDYPGTQPRPAFGREAFLASEMTSTSWRPLPSLSRDSSNRVLAKAGYAR
ncbi:hypothetical protein D9M68_703260 [compost metagenome]